MTGEQFTTLIEWLAALHAVGTQANTDAAEIKGHLENVVFLGQVCALGVGVIWGCLTWRLVILAKNQRTL